MKMYMRTKNIWLYPLLDDRLPNKLAFSFGQILVFPTLTYQGFPSSIYLISRIHTLRGFQSQDVSVSYVFDLSFSFFSSKKKSILHILLKNIAYNCCYLPQLKIYLSICGIYLQILDKFSFFYFPPFFPLQILPQAYSYK